MGIERTRRRKEPTEEHEDERNPRKKNHEEQRRRTDQVNTRNQVLNTRFLRGFFSISDCHHMQLKS